MGIIITKFQKKPTTRDILQKIQQEIQEIEDHKWSTIRKEKNYASLLFFISLSLLVVFIGMFLYYLPSAYGWRDKIILSVPIFILSLFVWLLKKTLQWYCRWSLDTKEARLRKLQKEKGRILDQVQETETFNVATELLERYDPKRLRKVGKPETQQHQQQTPAPSFNNKPSTKLSSIGSSVRRESRGPRSMPLSNTSFLSSSFHLNEPLSTINDNSEVIDEGLDGGITNQQQSAALRKRQSIATSVQHESTKAPIKRTQTGSSMDVSILNQTVPANISSYNQQVQNMAQLQVQSQAKLQTYQQLQTPMNAQRNMNTSIIAQSSVRGRPVRPVLSKERTFFEKVVDWVVADGPTNRFALICKYCYGHNGMALQEEFETLNFRCCYCCNLNTTHKQRQIHDQLQAHQENVDNKSKEQTTNGCNQTQNLAENQLDSEPSQEKPKKDAAEETVLNSTNKDELESPVEEPELPDDDPEPALNDAKKPTSNDTQSENGVDDNHISQPMKINTSDKNELVES